MTSEKRGQMSPRVGIMIAAGMFVALICAAYIAMNARGFQITGQIIERIDTDAKVVALTFDDGPQPFFTDTVLSVLRDEGVRATFYLTGKEISENREDARMIARSGHEIGNHSFSHQRMIFRSRRMIAEEVERTDALIRDIGYRGPITFRPPYFKKLVLLPWYLASHDRVTVTCDVEPDSRPVTASEMTAFVGAHVRPGSIILFHVMNGNRDESIKAVRPVIGSLKRKGYSFVTVSELRAFERK